MTGEELRQWRDNHDLSQAQLAQLLNMSRDQLQRREDGRVAIPEGFESVLELIAKNLGEKPPEAAKQIPNAPKGSQRRYLSLDGRRIEPKHILALKKGQCYYEYGWQDDESKHHYFNLMQMGLDAFRKLQGLCTPISLNVNTWTVGAFLQNDNEAVKRTIPDLQSRMDKNTANRPELSTVLMSNEDAFRPVGFTTTLPEGMFAK